MGRNIFKVDGEARTRIRMILGAGLFLLIPTVAFSLADGLTFAICVGVMLILVGAVLSERAERWLSGRCTARQSTAPGSAIDVSSVAQQLERLRTNYLGVCPRPQGPFHEAL